MACSLLRAAAQRKRRNYESQHDTPARAAPSQAFVALEKKSGSSPGAKLTLGWKPTAELRGGTRPAPRSLRNPAPPGSAGRTGCSLQRLRRCGCSWPRLRSTCAGRHPRPVPRVTRHYGSISGLSRQQRRISVSQRPRALAESPKPKILSCYRRRCPWLRPAPWGCRRSRRTRRCRRRTPRPAPAQ